MNHALLDDRRYPPTEFARFVLDEKSCDACRKCVDTCPGQLLEMQSGRPVNLHEQGKTALGCIGCSNCMAACPNGAIDIRGNYRVRSGFYRTTLGERAYPNPLGWAEAPAFDVLAPQLTEVERVIYTRRSNRLFKKKRVPEALIERVLEAGRFAPSQGNCQPWSFVVVTDRSLIDRIATQCERRVSFISKLYLPTREKRGLEKLKTLAVNALARLTPNNFDQRLAHGIDTIVSHDNWHMFLGAPVLILVAGDRRGIGQPIIDCMLAAHNMVLAAHSLGLGTCYVGFAKMIETLPELKKQLGIEWPYKVMTSVVLGYPRTPIDHAVAREKPPVRWFRPEAEAKRGR